MVSSPWLAQWTLHLDKLELEQTRRAPAQTYGSLPQLDQHWLHPKGGCPLSPWSRRTTIQV